MTSRSVTIFKKYIQPVSVPLNRCWNHCNKKIMQTRMLLFVLRGVDLPHPLFITSRYDSTGSFNRYININADE